MSRLRVLCPECDAVLRPKSGAAPRGTARCPRCGADVPLDFRNPGGRGAGPWIAAGAVAGVVLVGLIVALVVATNRNRSPDADDAAVDGSNPAQPADASSPFDMAVAGRDPENAVVPVGGNAPAGAAVPAGPVEILDEGPPPLRYRWQPGQRYGYEITISARSDAGEATVRGTCLYTCQPLGVDEFVADEEQGSGTGFVVHPDGILVTCAHVVENATKIEVTLGQQTHAAEVLAFDRRHDLAVLRVSARGLKIVPLGDSDRVELAQEVRAVGYPLSDILGDNVKITRGTVSGINSGSSGRILQIDAAINPGNSGGPLVDESGRVVGVASSKLTGLEVSGVGFAVPANEVKRLLAKRGLTFQTAGEATLTGPELARRITPAIALVKVTTGPGGVGAVERFKLAFDASYSSSRFGSERESGTAIISAFGELLDLTGEKQLPFLQGPIGAFVLAPLSSDGGKTWDETSRVSITRTESGGDDDFGRSAFGPPRSFGPPRPGGLPRFGPRSRFGPFGGAASVEPPKVTVLVGLEQTKFTLGAAAGPLIPIARTYELVTDETSGGRPLLKMKGEGTLYFDAAAGIPDHLDFTATLDRHEEDGASHTALQIAFRRLAANELTPDGGRVPSYQPAAPAGRPGSRSGRPGRLPMYRPRG